MMEAPIRSILLTCSIQHSGEEKVFGQGKRRQRTTVLSLASLDPRLAADEQKDRLLVLLLTTKKPVQWGRVRNRPKIAKYIHNKNID